MTEPTICDRQVRYSVSYGISTMLIGSRCLQKIANASAASQGLSLQIFSYDAPNIEKFWLPVIIAYLQTAYLQTAYLQTSKHLCCDCDG